MGRCRDDSAVTIDHTHGHNSHPRYRLTCDEMDQLLARSGNRCEVCDIPAAETTQGHLMIDHDHALGKWAVRGLLCHRCNVTLSRYYDPKYSFSLRRHLRPRVRAYLRRPFRGKREQPRFVRGTGL